jgi:hypothetical protein
MTASKTAATWGEATGRIRDDLVVPCNRCRIAYHRLNFGLYSYFQRCPGKCGQVLNTSNSVCPENIGKALRVVNNQDELDDLLGILTRDICKQVGIDKSEQRKIELSVGWPEIYWNFVAWVDYNKDIDHVHALQQCIKKLYPAPFAEEQKEIDELNIKLRAEK